MQKIAIVSSNKDPAGINIRNSVTKLFGFKEISEKLDNNLVYELKLSDFLLKSYLINDELVYADGLDKRINADIFIFASKHRSKENTKSFAVHSIGNWHEANLGGKPRTLCPTSPILLKNLFLELNKNAAHTSYEITMEATHHGPFVEKPSIFIEIGSTEEEWNDLNNGEIVATTIINGIQNQKSGYKIAVGIGGPHYCNNFNKIALSTDIAFSHICPKYMLEFLDEELLRQSLLCTGRPDFFILDWKGLGQYKGKVVSLIEKLNIKYKRSDKI